MTNIASPQELKFAVAKFCQCDFAVSGSSADQIKKYLDEMQEKPYLLDSVLADCVVILATRFLESPSTSHQAFEVLYLFAKTRGAKTIVQCLPSEPQRLVLLLALANQAQKLWTTRYCLLLWLSACIYTPFRLEVLGDNLFHQVFAIAAKYLLVSGLERDAAALLMARLVTRDSPPQIGPFCDWAEAQTIRLGALRAAAWIAPKSTDDFDAKLFELAETADPASSTESRLALKIKNKIALRNIDFVESAVGASMEDLSNESTAVRYSAAKAVARIGAKLAAGNPELVKELSEAVLDIFNGNLLANGGLDLVSDAEWHGALLALAEMLRRGLQLDHPLLLNVLGKALFFEQKRSTFSLGVNVRDAACYVCWSLFRNSPLLSEHLQKLNSWLISLACFDREVNIRRAAAAALQEGLGRQKFGSAQDTMALIETLNFQTVSQVSRCYLEIASRLNPNYEYLLAHGVLSWNATSRRLAAQSVALLKVPVEAIVPLFSVSDKDSVHGVLLALSALKAPASVVEPLLVAAHDYSSDLVCEAVLRGLVCVPLRTDLISPCLMSSEQNTMEAARSLLSGLTVPKHLLTEWEEKMHLSPTFVVALAAQNCQTALRSACHMSDLESCKIAVAALDDSPESHELVLEALDNYSTDMRGDVGSWVRQAAVRWTMKHPSDAALFKLWRIAAEPLDKLRLEASQVLASVLSLRLSWSTQEDYYLQLFELVGGRPQVMQSFLSGYIQSCGAVRASQETLKGSIHGAVKYAQRNDTSWLNELLNFDFLGKNGAVLVGTLANFYEHGIELAPQGKALAVAYNASLNTRNPRRLLPAIRMLACIPDERAHQRLVRLLSHPVPSARMQAAEALVELGYDLPRLLQTEWDGGECAEVAKQVAAEIVISL